MYRHVDTALFPALAGRGKIGTRRMQGRLFSLLLKMVLCVLGCKSPGHESWKLVVSRYPVRGGNCDAMWIYDVPAILHFPLFVVAECCVRDMEPCKYNIQILIVNMSINTLLGCDCSCDLCNGGKSCGHVLRALLAPQGVQSCQSSHCWNLFNYSHCQAPSTFISLSLQC